MASVDTPSGPVSILEDGDESDITVVLAHGAGAPMDSEFMRYAAGGIAAAGIHVIRFNFSYMEAGKKVPDRQPVLEGTFAALAGWARAERPSRTLVLGGKSLGGRIASYVAEATGANGLLFHGYPLHPPGRPDRMRDEHLRGIQVPMLFVEGTRDPFCPLDTMEKVRKRIPHSSLAVIEGGDHSFKVRKSSGRSTSDAWDEVVAVSVAWLKDLA